MGDRKKFLENLEFKAAIFQDLTVNRVLSISHNDGDGLTASVLICKTLEFLKIPFVQVIFERSDSWDIFLEDMLGKYKGIDVVILTDLGAEEKQICNYFKDLENTSVFLLDHHKIADEECVLDYPDNVHSLNVTRFGFDGLWEIAGCTLTFLFCEKICPKSISLAWLPVVGIPGDNLKDASHYKSFNKEILDVARDEGFIEIHEGLALLGGMAESNIKESMVHSILPFLPEVNASDTNAIKILDECGIPAGKKIVDLSTEESRALSLKLGDQTFGKYVILKGRKGILRHSFEYNFLIGIIGDYDPNHALELLHVNHPGPNDVKVYKEYMGKLIKNLAQIAKKSAIEGNFFKFFEVGEDSTKQLVSDTASFISVNKLLTEKKILIISKPSKTGKTKLSLRCTPEFVAARNIGIGTIISKLVPVFKGRGGGHDLAGGWLMLADEYKSFIENINKIDEIF